MLALKQVHKELQCDTIVKFMFKKIKIDRKKIANSDEIVRKRVKGQSRAVTAMLDLATSAVFIGAPLFALLNHLVVTGPTMPEEARPSRAIRALNIVAIIVMTSLAVAYFALTSVA